MIASAPPIEAPSSVHGARGQLFPATQWSAISQARGADDGRMAEGFRRLATGYWRPLYLYLRKRGESHADACDSVQGFFEFVFSTGFLAHIDREGGKFRSYLLRSLERWRSRRQTRELAQKRGGGVAHVSLDGVEEMQDLPDLAEDATPEQVFDRQWAAELVLRAVEALRATYARRERADWFEALRGVLPGAGTASATSAYSEVAAALGASEGAVKKAAHDLRAAFAAQLKEEIRATVRSKEDAEEELRYLVTVMSAR